MKNFYDVGEISKIFAVTDKTIKKYIREKRIKAIKLFGHWQVSKKEVERILKEGV